MAEPIYPQFISSQQLNAPQMGSTNGEMLTVLDAALITGCCPATASGAVIEGDFVKITFGVIHPYMLRQFIVIAGATNPALNGKHRITKVTSTEIWIAKGSITSTTGTLTVKIAPLGWESIFGTTSPTKRAFRSADPTSSRMVLYLNSEYEARVGAHSTKPSQLVKVAICEDMVELGVEIGSVTAAKSDKSAPHGFYHFVQSASISLGASAPDTPSPWFIIGDGKIFYFFVNYMHTYRVTSGKAGYVFGDLPRVSADDDYPCVFAASEFTWTSSMASANYFVSEIGGFTGRGFTLNPSPLSYTHTLTGSRTPESLRFLVLTPASVSAPTSGKGIISRLNPFQYGLVYSEAHILRGALNLYAGALPYLRYIATNIPSATESKLLDEVQQGDCIFVQVSAGMGQAEDNYGLIAIDLETPRVEDETI